MLNLPVLNRQPPTLGESAQAFMEEVAKRLPEEGAIDSKTQRPVHVKRAYTIAVADTLRKRRFRKLSHGLQAMADAAFKAHGESGIHQYLREQTALPLDASTARKARQTLGPALSATLRRGQRELDTVDTAEAFALEHGLELLEGTLQSTYRSPVVVDEAKWGASIRRGLQQAHEGMGNIEDVERLGDNVVKDLDGWQRVREQPSFASMLQALTRPATLGYRTSQFLSRIRDALPEDPTAEDFTSAVEAQLKLRRFKDYEPGLRALARAAWEEHRTKTNFIGAVLERLPADWEPTDTTLNLDSVDHDDHHDHPPKITVPPPDALFAQAVQNTLALPQFQGQAEKLQEVAQVFWADPDNIELDCYLREQSELSMDADVRDHWNRDNRTKLGQILSTAVRNGKKELTTADTIQAFALEHGLQMLEATVQDRYRPPDTNDVQAWKKEAVARLSADLKKVDPSEPELDLKKVDQLMGGFETTFASWKNMPEPKRRNLIDKLSTLMADLNDQPLDVLSDQLKAAFRKIQQVPTEAHLAVVTATTIAMLAKGGLAVFGAANLPLAGALAVGLMGVTVLAWGAADASGAAYHWALDNLPLGRTATAFQDHHYDPRSVSTWPLIRNTHGTARMVTPMMLAAASLPSGKMAAALLAQIGVAASPVALGALLTLGVATYLNGLLYTQHIHGRAHAREHELAPWERKMQAHGVFLHPEKHKQHHGKHGLGQYEFGVLNGMTNKVMDKIGFFRGLEFVYESFSGKEVGWKHEPELRKAAMKRKKRGFRPVAGCGI